MPDCGCGKKSKCITKGLAEQILGSFVRNNPQFNRKTKRATLMFIKKELKRLDCGCGCKGKNKFAQKYLTGGKLVDCPPGWRNDGLTCVEPCNSDEVDDGLTCRKKCTGEQINDGLTCRNPIKSSMDPCPDGSRDVAGTCWGTVRQDSVIDCIKHPSRGGECRGGEVHTSCNPIRTECNWGGWMNTVLSCNTVGGDCRTWADPISCNPIIPCGTTTWNVDGITRELKDRNLRTWGGEVFPQAIRGKRITERIDWIATTNELAKGFEEFMTGKLDYEALFDPEKNGVGAAFRKFGKDTEAAFEDIGKRFERAFDPNQNGVAQAFADFAKEAEKNLEQFGQDFVNKCKDPDMWVQVITIMAQVAGGILAAAIAVGTLGAGTGLAIGLGMALSAVGPAVKMIADGARGKPIDGLDIAMLALAVIPPVPGAGVVMGEGIRKAIQYGNYAAQAGKIIVAGVQAGQALGLVPSTCVLNCPPPVEVPELPNFEEDLGDEAILALRPDKNTYKWIYAEDGSRTRNPDFISDDDWIKKYKEDNPPSKASPDTKNTAKNADALEEDDEGIDFNLEDGEEPDFDFGEPGDEDEFDLGMPGEEDDEFDLGVPGEEEEDEFDLGIPGEEDEFEGEPGEEDFEIEDPEDSQVTAIKTQKKFMEKADPKRVPPPVIAQKQTPFSGLLVNKTLPTPKREYRVSSAPSLPMRPANQVIIPSRPRKEKFFLLGGGYAEMTQFVLRNNLYA